MVRKSTTVRSAVTSNDSSNPAVAGGANCFGYSKVLVEINISGASPVWSVTPLFINVAGDTYSEGETLVVAGAKIHRLTLEVDGNEDVNFRLDGQSGTNPKVETLKVVYPIAKDL